MESNDHLVNKPTQPSAILKSPKMSENQEKYLNLYPQAKLKRLFPFQLGGLIVTFHHLVAAVNGCDWGNIFKYLDKISQKFIYRTFPTHKFCTVI